MRKRNTEMSGNRKKVVFIVEAMLGGIRQHVCDVMSGLDREKYDIYLIYSENRADETFYRNVPELKNRGIRFIICNEMQRELGKQDFRAYKKLVEYLGLIKPDVVHCHSSKAGIVGRLAAKRCGVRKIIYTPHAYAFQASFLTFRKKAVYILAEWMMGRFMTSITVNVSEGERQLALKYRLMPEKKLKLIYNGIGGCKEVDRNRLRTMLGIANNKVLAGVTARCAKQKDPQTFLRIAEKVCGAREDVVFIYIGDGPLKGEMEKWVQKKGLTDKIYLPGFLDDASKLVAALDIYLSTALYEGLPYSMIEAMRAGVPLVATNVVGNNELVIDGENGLLFEAGNVAEGAAKVTEQLERGLIKRETVEKSFNSRFSLERMISEMDNIFS